MRFGSLPALDMQAIVMLMLPQLAASWCNLTPMLLALLAQGPSHLMITSTRVAAAQQHEAAGSAQA